MDARTAAKEALDYVCMLEGLSKGYEEQGGFLQSGNVAIEGARLNENGVWEISVGFERPWDKRRQPTPLSTLLVRNGGSRTIKTVSIDNSNSNVIDYESL
jgi:hypothetical protein